MKDDNIDNNFVINWLVVYKDFVFYNSILENVFVKVLREFFLFL